MSTAARNGDALKDGLNPHSLQSCCFFRTGVIFTLGGTEVFFFRPFTLALDQWYIRKLIGIKWYYHVQNDEVRWTTRQPTTPFSYCPSTVFLLVWPHYANAQTKQMPRRAKQLSL